MTAHTSRLYFQLQRTAAHLKAVADQALLEAAGITTAQAAVLTLLNREGPLKQNAIAKILDQKEAAVTQMIAKLEGKELVLRRRPGEDKRVWNVEITKRGNEVLGKAAHAFSKINERIDRATGVNQNILLDQLGNIRDLV